MISSLECQAKAEDMEQRARVCHASMRAEWTAMAGHWHGLEESARRHEDRTVAGLYPTLSAVAVHHS